MGVDSDIKFDPTIVKITQGKLSGKVRNTVNNIPYISYKGIPYAKPPIGELKFKPPVEPEPWNGVRDAYVEGNQSLSKCLDSNDLIGDEDCLYLNVYTKELPKDGVSLKPVMFWIHGGAWVRGSGSTELYGPDFLIAEDIVLVTFNYRLALAGFLYVNDPKAGVSGNNFLKDTIMALKWVQKNISAFNGDPNNVTVFGESVGSITAHLLIYSSMSKGLFHKIICQSGTAFDIHTLDNLTILAAEATGYKGDNELEAFNYLKDLSSEKFVGAWLLLDSYIKGKYNYVGGPKIESKVGDEPKFLTETPEVLCKRGEFMKIPLLIGTNLMDGMVFASTEYYDRIIPINFNDSELLVPRFMNVPKGSQESIEIGERIMKFYYGNETPSKRNADKFVKYQTDVKYLLLTLKAVKYHLKFNAGPVYLYNFSLDSPCNLYKKLFGMTMPGVCHGDELTYLFHSKYHHRLRFGITEENTVQRLCKYWANFARTGNPNPSEPHPLFKTKWEPVQSGVYNHLNIGKVVRAINNEPHKDRMQFWNQLFKDYGIEL